MDLIYLKNSEKFYCILENIDRWVVLNDSRHLLEKIDSMYIKIFKDHSNYILKYNDTSYVDIILGKQYVYFPWSFDYDTLEE